MWSFSKRFQIQLTIVCAFVAALFSHLPVAGAQSEAGEGGPPPLVVFAAPGAGADWSARSESALSEEGAATLESIRSDPLASDIQIGRSAPGAVLSTRALSLALPSGPGEEAKPPFVFASVIVEYSDEGFASVHARDDEAGSEVSVVIDGEDVFGSVQRGDEHYRMRPLGDGHTAVFRYDVSQLQEHGPGYPDFIRNRLEEHAPPWEPPAGATDTGDVIDIMIVHTRGARTAAGNMDLWIQSALDNTRRIYGNTNIRPRLRLVHKFEASYSEGSSMREDLERLTYTDGYLDEVRTRRDQYGADLVVLVVERDQRAEETCGTAWINFGRYGSGPNRGFGVVDVDCEDGHYTFAHEVGHNQGGEHNPDRVANPPAVFSYGHGFCNVDANWSTVMSYRSNDTGSCRERIRYFSSPLVNYQGTPTGDAAVRDNRRVLNETAYRLANFRQTVLAPAGVAHTLPLIIASGHPFQQGFVRIINHSDRAGTVQIRAIDDSGQRFSLITLSLPAMATRHFNSDDLETGNSFKGLSGGVGDGEGNWRLELESDLDIEPLAYIRTDDRFLTSMHDVVAGDQSTGYQAPFFNEGSHPNQSALRLINTADAEAEVVIDALDDHGRPPPGGTVHFSLPPQGACRISGQELESGSTRGRCNRGFSGGLGDGGGKWHLSVSANRPLLVMNLMATSSGHLTNLSTSTGRNPGTPPPTPLNKPDLVIQPPSTSNPNPNAGERFTLTVAVRNQGDAPSSSARLRFYGSADPTISTGDTEIETTAPVTVGALPPSGISSHAISLSSPTIGIIYLGACVDPVSGESNTRNNCSPSVRVTVGQPVGGNLWGAIAAGWVDRNQCSRGSGWNSAINRRDRSTAASAVLARCRSRDLDDCAVLSQFTGCGSLARGSTANECHMTGGFGASSSAAEQSALSTCRSLGPANCRILADGRTGDNATYCNSGFQAPPPSEGRDGGITGSLSGIAEPGSGTQEPYDTGEEVVEDPFGRIEAGRPGS